MHKTDNKVDENNNNNDGAVTESVSTRHHKSIQKKLDPYFCFDKKVEITKVDFGNALIAREFIPAGAIIWINRRHLNPDLHIIKVRKAEILSWDEKKRDEFLAYAWQDEEDLWDGNASIEDVKLDAMNFLNHSCDPNIWFATDDHISARRDIQNGEELRFDYATCDSEFISIEECKCGAKNCRKKILPTDWSLPLLKRTYDNHYRFYLLKKIEEQNKTRRKLEAEQEEKKRKDGKSIKSIESKTNAESHADDEEKLIELSDDTRGEGFMFEMHKSIEVRGSKVEGRGLYATTFLPKGTVVWEAHEYPDDMWKEYDESEVASLDEDTKRLVSYYYEMNTQLKYRGPICMEFVERDCSNFYNHSCDPNTWFINDSKLAALRDIEPGEELTYDYATCKPQTTKVLHCRCGTSKCRGKITQEDYKLPDIQKRFGKHFVSHWLKLMHNKQ